MKKGIFILMLIFASQGFCQEIQVLIKKASNYERAVKEDSAILMYQTVLGIDSNNSVALIRLSQLTTSLAARQSNKVVALQLLDKAMYYADKSFMIDSTNVEAIFAKGICYLYMGTLETDNKKMVVLLRGAYTFAGKALSINPNHGKSNFLIGKWNSDIVKTAWSKKATVKILYGGLPDASIDSAIFHYEKCRIAEPYFVQNFLELAKAYHFNNNPQKALEVLNILVKLPVRTADDVQWKTEGKKLLNEIQ